MRILLWLASSALAAGLLAVYLGTWFIALTSRYSLEYEGPCLWAATELARGHNIYDAITLVSPPWAVMIYTPLYFLLASVFCLSGSPDYFGLRVISMVSFLVAITYTVRLFWLYTHDRLVIFVGALTFVSFIPVWAWSWKARVDMLSVALSIMSIYYFCRTFAALRKQAPPGPYVLAVRYLPSVLLAVAAIYTKQPSFVIPAAVCAFLLVKRKFIDLLVYGALTAVFLGAVLGLTQLVTAGGFWAHMTFGAKMPFSMQALEKHLSWIGADWAKLLLIAALMLPFLVATVRGKIRYPERVTLPIILIVISGVLTIYTLGTTYANLNHGLLFLFGCAWLVVLLLRALPRLGVACLIASMTLSVYVMGTILPTLADLKANMSHSEHAIASRHSELAGTTIFVEDPYLAMVSGSKPLFVDVATFLQVWARDGKSLIFLEEALREGQYPVAVINRNDSETKVPAYFWPRSLVDVIHENYEKVETAVGNGEIQDVYFKADEKN